MTTHLSRLICRAGLLGLLLPAAAGAQATDPTTVRLINLLVEQGVLTRDKADALLKEASTAPTDAAGAGAAAKPAPPPPVRVPYVPEFVRKEIKDEVRTELAAQAFREGWAGPGSVPEWVRGLAWDGDLRARLQRDNFAEANAPAISVLDTNRNRAITLANTTENRSRLRARARLGLTATLDDNWAAAARLTTGSATDPLSSNQTLGNYGNRYTVAFDRANIRYRYGSEFSAVVGRFGNPWFGTDLVWANDLGFDGVVGQWTPKLNDTLRGFLTVGVMPIQEVELSSADKWLLGAQIGAQSTSLFGSGASGRVGLAYYRYTHIVGQTSPATNPTLNEFTAPQFVQKGNTYYNISSDPAGRPLFGLAADFRLVDITGALDVPAFGGKHVIVTGDFVKNLGYDRAEVAARVGTDIEPKTKGYLARVAFGDREVARRGEWQTFVGYKHVERDAVLDAFTDSDLRLGGTDTKGYTLGGTLGLGRNTSATVRLLSGDSISGAPLSVDVLQVDLNVRF